MRRVHVHLHIPTRDARPLTREEQHLAEMYAELARRMWAAVQELDGRTGDGAWHEDLHPRAPDGRFGEKSGEHEAKEAPAGARKSGMHALHALLSSGQAFTREQLLEATGLKDRKLTDYLAMLKNPKYAKPGVLNIERLGDGRFQVKLPNGQPARPNPGVHVAPPSVRVVAPPPAPTPQPVREVQTLPPVTTPLGERAQNDSTSLAVRMWGHRLEVVGGGMDNGNIRMALTDPNARFTPEQVHVMNEEARSLGLTAINGGPVVPPVARGQRFVFYRSPAPKNIVMLPTAQPAAAPAAPATPALPKTWAPAKTAKEATERAVKEGWVTGADFGRMAPEAANEYMTSVAEHFTEFPELRNQQFFVGTNGAFKKRVVEMRAKAVKEALLQKMPNATAADIKRHVEFYARPPRIPNKAWALAWDAVHTRGNGRAITVNEKYSTDVKASRAAMEANVASGFHAPGCTTHKSTMDHELGHQLDYLLALRKHPEVQRMYQEAMTARRLKDIPEQHQVSKYGMKNPAEFIAETWAEARNSPTPRPMARRMADIIRSEYARKFAGKA